MISKLKKILSSPKNRRLLILIAVALMLLALAAILRFGVDRKKTVGICYSTVTDPSNAVSRQTLEKALAERGFEVVITNAGGNQARQLEQIQAMAERRCKAIVVEPVMLTAGEELSRAIGKAGLPAVLISRRIEGMEHIPCIDGDQFMPGRVLGQMVLELPDGGDINGDGVVSCLLLQGSEQDAMADRLFDGFAEAMGNAQLLSVSYGNWTKDGGKEACSRALGTYGKDIEVILCTSDAMAIGAADGVTDGGWQIGRDVYLYGLGAEQEALRLLQDGEMTGTVHIDWTAQANGVIDVLLAQIAKENPENRHPEFYTPVTNKNAQHFLQQTQEP